MRLIWLFSFLFVLLFFLFQSAVRAGARRQTKLAGPEASPLASLLWNFHTACCRVSTFGSAYEHERAPAAPCTQYVNIVGQ